MIPYLECHQLLVATNGAYADEGFDIEEHINLFNKHYPPRTKEDHEVLSIICMGKNIEPKEKNEDSAENIRA